MMRTPSWRRAIAALLLASLGASASAAAATEAAGTVLRTAVPFSVGDLDPVVAYSGFYGIAQPVTRVNLDGEVELTLAESLEQPTPNLWVLTLKPGITFQNGRPVDGQAVAAAFTRQLAERPSAADAIPGAKVEATGEREVTITTEQPQRLVPVALAVADDFGVYDVDAVAGAADTGPAIAGLGAFTAPYEVVELTDTHMTLERYAGCWEGRPPLAGVEVSVVQDVQARLAAVESGEIDIAYSMNVPEVARALAGGEGDVRMNLTEAAVDLVRLYLNNAEPPFDDPAVRRAVRAALDYETIATGFLEGTQEASHGLFPDTLPQAADDLVTDPKAAAALLDGAGWVAGPDGTRAKDGVPLEVALLIYTERPELGPVSLAIQDQLGDLGIGVEIIEQSYDAAMYDDLSRWDAALYLDYSVSATGVPDTALPSYLRTGGAFNYGRISDPQLDSLIDNLAVAPDDATRDQLLADIQELVADHSWSCTFSKSRCAVAGVRALREAHLPHIGLAGQMRRCGGRRARASVRIRQRAAWSGVAHVRASA
ncbi:MAG: ABC transporter substrate-binding protein [Egibacteraceae bacterium]